MHTCIYTYIYTLSPSLDLPLLSTVYLIYLLFLFVPKILRRVKDSMKGQGPSYNTVVCRGKEFSKIYLLKHRTLCWQRCGWASPSVMNMAEMSPLLICCVVAWWHGCWSDTSPPPAPEAGHEVIAQESSSCHSSAAALRRVAPIPHLSNTVELALKV